jgi:hypothetical protein
MKVLREVEITIEDIFNYITELSIFRLNIIANGDDFIIITRSVDLYQESHFTTCKKLEDGSYVLTLSKADIFNSVITRGWFKYNLVNK